MELLYLRRLKVLLHNEVFQSLILELAFMLKLIVIFFEGRNPSSELLLHFINHFLVVTYDLA